MTTSENLTPDRGGGIVRFVRKHAVATRAGVQRTLRSARRAGSLTIGAVIAGVIAITGVGLVALPAQAATTGAGWFSQSVGHLGNYITEDGKRVYCAEADHFPGPTVGVTDGGTLHGEGWAKYGGGGHVSAIEAVQMNHILTHYGETDNPEQAAAVQMFLWSIISPVTYNSHAYPGDQWYITRAPAGSRPQIKALLNQFRAEAANVSLPSPNVTGSASLSIQMTDAYNGTVTVSTNPADAWGMLYLEGATVAGTGQTQVPVVNGSVATIVGNPLDEQGKYNIRASADFTANVGGGLGANFRIHNTGDGRAQKTISRGDPATSQISFSANTFVTDPIDTRFAPVLSSRVGSKYVQAGEAFEDVVIFRTLPGAPKWRERRDGTYYEVRAKGTLYGPFDAPLIESDTVPAGAPIAGTTEIRTTAVGGPNEHYRARIPSNGIGGHYSWVWDIKASDQNDFTRMVMVENYNYSDRFGQPAETSTRPFKVEGTSQLSHTTVPLSAELTDTFVPVAPDGNWFFSDTAGKNPIELDWRVTSYFVPGDPTVPLPVSKTVPKEAEEIQHELVSTTGKPMITTKPIVADSHRAGHVTVRWCLNTADQQPNVAPLVVPWCDDFGLPSETASVTLPEITTEAQPTVTLYAGGTQTLSDTAIVGGTLPAKPMNIRFEAFVEAYEDEGETGAETPVTPVDPQPGDPNVPGEGAGETPVAPERVPVCTKDNLVWSSTQDIVVSDEGRYRSQSWDPLEVLDPELLPSLGSDTPVKIWFIETAYDEDDNVIVSGKCGLESETSRLYNPELFSQAGSFGVVGAEFSDEAFVAGDVPTGSSVIWEVYSHAADAERPVCEIGNRVWSSVEAGVDAVPVLTASEREALTEAGETVPAMMSEAVKLPVGVNLWVATLLDHNGDVMRRGECGEEGEVTIVDPEDCPPIVTSSLPRTGLEGGALLWPLIGGGALLLLGATLVLMHRKKRLSGLSRGAMVIAAAVLVTGAAGASIMAPQLAHAAADSVYANGALCGPQNRTFETVPRVDPSTKERVMPEVEHGDTQVPEPEVTPTPTPTPPPVQ